MPDHIDLHIESPRGRETVRVSHVWFGRPISELLRHETLALNTRCGQRGLCDGCLVEVIDGSLCALDGGAEVRGRSVRACRHTFCPEAGPLGIHIPARSLLAHEPQVLGDYRINVSWAFAPLTDNGELHPTGNPSVTTARDPLGVAIDLGTTTVALQLINLSPPKPGASAPDQTTSGTTLPNTAPHASIHAIPPGTVLAKASAFNKQMHLGDDVLTRINLCFADPDMLAQLQHAVVAQTIAPLLKQALSDIGAPADRVAALTVAGNTTMLHLLAGVDPTPMGVAPFIPVFLEHRTLPAGEIRLHLDGLDPLTPVHLLPGAAAYVGADLVAGVLATGMYYHAADERRDVHSVPPGDPAAHATAPTALAPTGPAAGHIARSRPISRLLVDVGTNGEIILQHGRSLLGCATAAGPAFEGAGLSSGIRAGRGAVAHIRFDPQPFAIHTQVIGDAKPIGLCGSAYIDFLAEARRVDLINSAGRFDTESPLLAQPGMSDRFRREAEHVTGLAIARGIGGADVLITETDIAALLQAKAAVAAGILTLLRRAELRPDDIDTLYLAGGFGMHMTTANAIGCGLLPGFTLEQVQLVGNTSLAGAYLSLVDRSVMPELSRVARGIELVELNLEPDFESTYIDQLMLP